MNNKKLNAVISRTTLAMFIIGMGMNFMVSCVNKKQGVSDAEKYSEILHEYSALKDSVDTAWGIMIDDDNDKHQLMKRLLLEVSYTNNYDKERFGELNDLVDQLKAMRYDQTSMQRSALIDAYDSATFDLSDQIIVFARNHPRYEDFPLMAELIDDINGKNNYILMHRIHYDSRVKELNLYKKKNRKKLLAADPDIETMPLFELPS